MAADSRVKGDSTQSASTLPLVLNHFVNAESLKTKNNASNKPTYRLNGRGTFCLCRRSMHHLTFTFKYRPSLRLTFHLFTKFRSREFRVYLAAKFTPASFIVPILKAGCTATGEYRC